MVRSSSVLTQIEDCNLLIGSFVEKRTADAAARVSVSRSIHSMILMVRSSVALAQTKADYLLCSYVEKLSTADAAARASVAVSTR